MSSRRPETPADRSAPRGAGTVQLSADFLDYARERFTAPRFKDELERRLLPTVPADGSFGAIEPDAPFGKFWVVDGLGRGGMAEVYLARDSERLDGTSGDAAGALVALKVMRPELAADAAYVRRFIREAANTALIDHPNVVSVLEVGAVEGRLYFTMEFIQGETLKDHLAAGPMPEEEGLQVLCQLVDGLVAAHQRGITHRDLKPSNIMLVTNEARYGFGLADEFDVHVKITDFGLAQMIDLDESQATAGHFLGTAKYVAPEVVRGEPATLQSDVYSLGVLAFQVFAGRAPFRARNKAEFVVANLSETPARLDAVVPVSADLGRLVDAMLDKEPGRRPAALGLRRDLLRLGARRGREPVRVVDDPTSVFLTAPPVRSAPRLPRIDLDDPRVIVAGAAAALVVVLALLMLLIGGGAPPPPPPLDLPPEPPRAPAEVAPRGEPPSVAPGDPLGVRVRMPPGTAFRDQLARLDFDAAMTDGDAAWRRGEGQVAVEAWRRAASLLSAPRADLARRIRVGARGAALREGDAAREAGDLVAADRAYRRGLEVVPQDPTLLQRHEALTRRRHQALDAALEELGALLARPEGREEARRRRGAIEAEARALGRERDVEAVFEGEAR